MKKPIATVLDEGIEGLAHGKMVETCVALSGEAGEEIAPLLYTAEHLSQAFRAEPTEEFRRSARGRLMARLAQTQPLPARRHTNGVPVFNAVSRAFSNLSLIGPNTMKTLATVAVIAIVLAVTLGVGTFQTGASPAAASLATECTLTILNGNVQIQEPNAAEATAGVNGQTLQVGTTVTTSEGGGALLTFFEGSELQLEANTTIEITQVSEAENHAIAITLTQLAGNTWSHVTKMVDRYSKYEIHTPTAVALVRGTRFLTQVDGNSGRTKVETAEGLVSVAADGEEVYVPVGKKTIVNPGQMPTVPVVMSVPDDEAPEMPNLAQLDTNPPIQGSLLGLQPLPTDNGQGQANNNAQGQANGIDKTNNGQGQANGLSDDKTNNGQGQANGLSDNKTNNGQGQANGVSDNKTNNGQGQTNSNNGQGQTNSNSGQGQTNSNNGQGQTNSNSGQTGNSGQGQTNSNNGQTGNSGQSNNNGQAGNNGQSNNNIQAGTSSQTDTGSQTGNSTQTGNSGQASSGNVTASSGQNNSGQSSNTGQSGNTTQPSNAGQSGNSGQSGNTTGNSGQSGNGTPTGNSGQSGNTTQPGNNGQANNSGSSGNSTSNSGQTGNSAMDALINAAGLNGNSGQSGSSGNVTGSSDNTSGSSANITGPSANTTGSPPGALTGDETKGNSNGNGNGNGNKKK